MLNSQLAVGHVFHKRTNPKHHQFRYPVFLLWLDLDELTSLNQLLRFFSTCKWNWAYFRRADYIQVDELDIKQSVLAKAQQLGAQLTDSDSKVTFLGNARYLGFYFSPVNFYFVGPSTEKYNYMLAEVSNTPWLEKHYYLVDLNKPQEQNKEFTVSPFNDLNMKYTWAVANAAERINISIICVSEVPIFEANVNLTKKELNSLSLFRALVKSPIVTLLTVLRIYWQALRIWLKGVPFLGYNGAKNGVN